MTLPDAKKAAREIAGADMHVVSYRNVWGFFGSSDRELQAVFITKDNASTERSGIFLDKGEEGRFTEYATGRSVPANAVFGKAFFDEDPALFAKCGPASVPAVDRIESLLHESEKRLTAHGLPAGALVMLYDIANCEDSDRETDFSRRIFLYVSGAAWHLSFDNQHAAPFPEQVSACSVFHPQSPHPAASRRSEPQVP